MGYEAMKNLGRIINEYRKEKKPVYRSYTLHDFSYLTLKSFKYGNSDISGSQRLRAANEE